MPASELHCQAVVYHCLRELGPVPAKQLGMNVKMWISDVVSDRFKVLDLKKNEDFRGGFEPIPDVVLFKQGVRGDFRRRNRDDTLQQMLLAIKIKASERERKRLGPKEVKGDMLKLEAHRIEARHREADFIPVVMVIDTAPERAERMTRQEAVEAAKSASEEREICFFYLSQDDDFYTIPDAPDPQLRNKAPR